MEPPAQSKSQQFENEKECLELCGYFLMRLQGPDFLPPCRKHCYKISDLENHTDCWLIRSRLVSPDGHQLTYKEQQIYCQDKAAESLRTLPSVWRLLKCHLVSVLDLASTSSGQYPVGESRML